MTSQSLEIRIVIERLEALEKQNRRLKGVLALAFLLVGCLLVMGAGKKGKVVQANEFLLRDGAGKTRAALRMGSAGPDLIFYDADGKAARALLGVLPSGPALGFYDSNGKTRVSLSVTAKGPSLTFHDSDDKLRSELGMLEEGPHLMFLTAEGKPEYKAP